MTVLATQPAFLDFGSNYAGAQVEAAFQIMSAGSIVDSKTIVDCAGHACAEEGLPQWLSIDPPVKTPHGGLISRLRIDTSAASRLFSRVQIECDTGTAMLSIQLDLRQHTSSVQDLAICPSPFDPYVDAISLQCLVRILTHLGFRIHFTDDLSSVLRSKPRTLLIHGSSLIRLSDSRSSTTRTRIHDLVRDGTNLVILADHFFEGTIQAANCLIESYGMKFLDIPLEQTDSIRIVSERRDISEHSLMAGVQRMLWVRPSAIVTVAADAIPLVTAPANPTRCFAATDRRQGCVAAVGTSLWSALATVGWPYDNDRFLANVLGA